LRLIQLIATIAASKGNVNERDMLLLLC
jgi:hypothetical protein